VETRKLENVTKSPVLHHLSSTSSGIAVIRAYGRQETFQRRFNADLNTHQAAGVLYRFSNRWFVFRMDILGTTTIVLAGAYAVAGATNGGVSSALAGLVLANVFQTCTFLPFVMQMKAELKARFNSVERVCEYVEVSMHSVYQQVAT